MGRQFEIQLNELIWRWTLYELGVASLALLITALVSFLVLRAGVREGMLQFDERRRKPAPPLSPPTSPGVAPAGFKWVLVPDDALPHAAKPMDMRADR